MKVKLILDIKNSLRNKKGFLTSLFLIIFILGMAYYNIAAKRIYKQWKFHGVIDSISISERGYKSVYLNTTQIYLSRYGTNLNFLVGDSIIKYKDSLFFSIYKKDSFGTYNLYSKKYFDGRIEEIDQ